MNEQEYLFQAIASLLTTGKSFGWKKEDDNGNIIPNNQRMVYANLVINDDTITKPTETEVNAKIQELKDAKADKVTKKASGKQKLLDLGLSEEEVKALIEI